jgi:hypothetical protein
MKGRVRVARLLVCVVLVCAMVGAVHSGLGVASSGRQQAEWVQIVIVVPARLDNEAAWMHRAIQPLDAAGRPKLDHMTVKGKRVPILWNNAGAGLSTTDEMLRYAAKPYGGPYGASALLVDRKLTPVERRVFTVVPLWTDADILLVEPGSDLCTTGLTLRRVRMLLGGKDRGLRLTVPVNRYGTARSSFDVMPAKSVRTAQESSLVASTVGAGDAAVVGFQLARPAIEGGTACAAPIDGVAPTVATVRSGRYPVSRPVGFAFNKAVYRSKHVGVYGNAIRARFLEHAKGALGRAFIAGRFGRGALPGW